MKALFRLLSSVLETVVFFSLIPFDLRETWYRWYLIWRRRIVLAIPGLDFCHRVSLLSEFVGF